MRLRILFAKAGALRYTGHLDLHRLWERTARRAALPLAYSQGFHPQPKIQIAAALPLGFLGREEIVDIWIRDVDAPARSYVEVLQSAVPPGLTILRVDEVAEGLPALQTQVAAAEYEVRLLEADLVSGLEAGVAEMLAKESLPRERRGKPYDLRPLILGLECRGSPVDALYLCLSAREGATGRPEEVLDELGIPFERTRIERTRLILKDDIE